VSDQRPYDTEPTSDEVLLDAAYDVDEEDDAVLDALWDAEGRRDAARGNPPPGYVSPQGDVSNEYFRSFAMPPATSGRSENVGPAESL
jgi:hypothetical protein